MFKSGCGFIWVVLLAMTKTCSTTTLTTLAQCRKFAQSQKNTSVKFKMYSKFGTQEKTNKEKKSKGH